MTTTVLEKWHSFVKTTNPEILQNLLAEDVIFYSPVVHTPQKGKMITAIYLQAATQTFGENREAFKYVKEVVNDQHIILEFATEIDGIVVNY